MKNKGFLLSVLIVIIVGASIYAYLGGFNQPQITRTVTKEIHIAGKPFQGSVKSVELGELFMEAGQLHDNNQLPGDLGNIFYNDPEKNNDSIRAFIGLVVPDAATPLPAGYELRTLPAGKPVLQVRIDAHYML
ncbi:MAG TPA: GyrI-like domain-containing protein, partial [Adhaeribacter sp.]|nr:GyrI-like domain-containing protein [Adhaeribacter sp.]